jgi:hypothetical protein
MSVKTTTKPQSSGQESDPLATPIAVQSGQGATPFTGPSLFRSAFPYTGDVGGILGANPVVAEAYELLQRQIEKLPRACETLGINSTSPDAIDQLIARLLAKKWPNGRPVLRGHPAVRSKGSGTRR